MTYLLNTEYSADNFDEWAGRKLWDRAEWRGLRIGGRRYWAKMDSPDEYKEILHRSKFIKISRKCEDWINSLISSCRDNIIILFVSKT